MKYLSLFSGIAGGDLGLQHLLGWRCLGYVEQDKYCCRVLEQRIKDRILSDAPIFFGDIREWIKSGYATAYQGMVDAVAGGFPCQPFSVAGKKEGKKDRRNMWPETIETIRQIQPRYCFFENVRGLLSSGYFQEILKDLAESGYDARWRVLSAAEVGAPHKRDRLWIVAYANNGRCTQHQSKQEWQVSKSGQVSWWRVEPALDRVADGYAGRVAELQAAGNAQVPLVAATAWHLLTGEESE